MITAYKVSAIEYYAVGRAIAKRIPSIILANLLLGENVVPELLQHRCTADALAAALLPLFGDTEERRRQIAAFARLDAIMEIASAARSARNRAGKRRYRAGAVGRSSAAGPRSFPSTGKSSRLCARPRTAR